MGLPVMPHCLPHEARLLPFWKTQRGRRPEAGRELTGGGVVVGVVVKKHPEVRRGKP